MSDKEPGKLRKLAKVPLGIVSMPASVAVPKTLRKSQKFFVDTLKGAHAVPCPFCAHGHLLSVVDVHYGDESEYSEEELENRDKINKLAREDKIQVWQCNVCEKHIETQTNNIDEVLQYVGRNGRKLYESGYAYQKRQEQIQDGQLAMLVDRRAFYSKVFYSIAVILTFPFLYGAATGNFMYALSIFMFALLFMMLGISNMYRSWQMYTDNVFPDDPKGQFHWWFKSRNWLVSPTNGDINDTYPPVEESAGEFVDDGLERHPVEEEYHESDHYEEGYEGTEELLEPEYYIPDFSQMIFYYVESE